jgi:hypothetical protein
MSARSTLHLKASVALAAISIAIAGPAAAFCGFYVAKADAKLFNKSSKVVLSRDGQNTAVTMASDYAGEPREFALVIPVPTFIERNQIGVVDMKMVDHLDAFTAPRLVEYHDVDPCIQAFMMAPVPSSIRRGTMTDAVVYKGVTVEANYDVAEYDVSILSATESDGLVHWLVDNGYRIPAGAEPVLASYIKQKMRFFVAKVNLERMALLGNGYLRPLQVRYETSKFMLPLRLGTVNAGGAQDLLVYALTRQGRVETTNYRTVKLPSDLEVPLFVKQDFGTFYKAMFERAVARENMRAVFVEYAWDMGWCDPCAADPLTNEELVALGARWIGSDNAAPFRGASGSVYVTRLHVRYDASSFPEDLAFIETADRSNFQARYVLRHPWKGEAKCDTAQNYLAALPERFKKQASNLAELTGWPQRDIERRMDAAGQSTQPK